MAGLHESLLCESAPLPAPDVNESATFVFRAPANRGGYDLNGMACDINSVG